MADVSPDLRAGRKRRGWTQAEAAERLGVSQPYLSLLESGHRPLTEELTRTAVRHFGLSPTVLPHAPRHRVDSDALVRDLAALGYSGFAYVKGGRRRNPASVLLTALGCDDLDPRVTEALPWLLLAFPSMDEGWLVREAKVRDLQNRLGFVATLARHVGEARSMDVTLSLSLEEQLYPSRLAREVDLCESSMSETTRTWFRAHRTEDATRWNVLTNLEAEHLSYDF